MVTSEKKETINFQGPIRQDDYVDEMARFMDAQQAFSKHNLVKSFDYAPQVTSQMCRHEYTRNGAAAAIVDLTVNTTWRTTPRIEDNSLNVGSQLEEFINGHFDDVSFWKGFRECDKRALITGWSGGILRIADGKDPSLPVSNLDLYGGVEAIQGIVPVWNEETSLKPVFVGNTTVVDHWLYAGPRQQHIVHPDRIIIFSENGRTDEPGMITKNYDTLRNLAKLKGATAEGFWKIASARVFLRFKDDVNHNQMDDTDIGNAEGPTVEKKLSNAMVNFNKGFNPCIASPLIDKAEQISTQFPDPQGAFNILAQDLGAGSKIPMRHVFGSETGSLASSQDRNNYYDTVESRRENTINPIIQDFIKRMQRWGAIPDTTDRKQRPVWQPLNDMTSIDAASAAEKLMLINEKAYQMGMPLPYDINDIRKASRHVEYNDEELNQLPVLDIVDDGPVESD